MIEDPVVDNLEHDGTRVVVLRGRQRLAQGPLPTFTRTVAVG